MSRIKLSRSVPWIGKIDDKGFERTLREIAPFHEKDPEDLITLFISSGGGSSTIAFAFYDFIKAAGIKLRTIGIGEVDSAAVTILMSGIERLLAPHTTMVLHQSRSNLEYAQSCQSTELQTLGEEHRILGGYYADIITSSTEGKFPREDVDRMVMRSEVLTPERAISIGLVHGIWSSNSA